MGDLKWFFLVGVLILYSSLFVLPVSAINISSCLELNVGGVYELTTDITSDSEICIKITETGVTLDCGGHKISGNGSIGIYSDKFNTIIKNCVLEGWEKGIDYEGSNNGWIENTTISSTKTGIYFSSSSNNTIINSKIENNDCGLDIRFSTWNKIYNNLFNNTKNVNIKGNYTQLWNTTKQNGNRIYSPGNQIGGNYWTNPSGKGYSDTCKDLNTDGFCDDSYKLTEEENNIDYLPLSNKYTPDTTPPEIRIISPQDNQKISSLLVETKVYVQDSRFNYANISLEQNGEVEDYVIIRDTGTHTIILNVSKEGYHNITAIAYDFEGNSNSTKVLNILTPMPVDKCSDLDIEGEIYFLKNDITNNESDICIKIQADNITLDCQNHRIYSSGGIITQGIHLSGRKNVVIKNCKISGWTHGILLEDSSKNKIFNSIIFNNSNGISMSSSSANTIYNNLFNNTNNVHFEGNYLHNFWNIERQTGVRIYSNGTEIGGNYWSYPSGNGYSDICNDADQDGFCDDPYDLGTFYFTGFFLYRILTGLFLFGLSDEENIDNLPLSDEYVPDLIPPNTTIVGYKEDGTEYSFGEWTNSSYINIILNCSDTRSGCEQTLYCINSSNTCKPNIVYSNPFNISAEGISYIRFMSIDKAGNNETIQTKQINIISKEQKIIINSPHKDSYLNDYLIPINITILDNQNLNYTNISIYDSMSNLVNSTISTRNGTYLVHLSVPYDGSYHIKATFYSKYGWIDEYLSSNVSVDTTPPEIISIDAKGEYRIGEDASAICHATDNMKGNFEVSIELDTSTTGEKTFNCTVSDYAGNNVSETIFYRVVEPVCTENVKRCDGDKLQMCVNNSWATIEICNYTCDPSLLKCIPKPKICIEGEKRCSEDELQVCENNSWKTSKLCEFGCNETTLKCNPNPNPAKLPPMIIIYIVILILIVGSVLTIIYLKLFEKPIGKLNMEIARLESEIKKLKMEGKDVKEIEKELQLANQDIRMGLLEMAKTRIKVCEKKLKEIR